MNRSEMVNVIYDKERIRSELISKELWKKLAEMTDEELEKSMKKYSERKNKKMDDSEDICGKCLHHRKENEEWICNNPDSECWGCYTEYRDACDEFEERSGRTKFSVEIVKK